MARGTRAAVILAILVAATAPAAAQDPSLPEGWQEPVRSVEQLPMPGQVMDIAMADDVTGYVSLSSGGIARFDLSKVGSDPSFVQVVATGLDHPRGIAVRDGALYVIDLGPFPCPAGVSLCEGPVLDPEQPTDGEVAILASTRATLLAYDIAADGTLGPSRVLVGDLPVVNALHAVNGLTVGPDGALYLGVGNVDQLWYAPERVAGTTPHPEWLGTILRIDPDSAQVTVFAAGLRNVYEVAFDSTGRLWAIDNDGPTRSGYRQEEVLQLREGHDYGYPDAGTFLGDRAREDGPVWISDTVGSAGLAWGPDAGLPAGLLIGDCRSLTFLGRPDGRLEAADWERGLTPGNQQVLGTVPTCLTSIQPIGDHEILVGATGGDGPLYRVGF